MKPKIPTIAEASAKIRFAVELWPGNCYSVASALVKHKLVRGEAVYGHWLGPIAPGSHFSERGGPGFIQHGWIRYGSWIVDPTRFVFEGADPYIFVGKAEEHPEYDEGGNRLRELDLRPCPAYGPDRFTGEIRTVPLRLDRKTQSFVDSLCGDKRGLTVERMFWLANLPVSKLGTHARAIYMALIEADEGAAIPLDNCRMVLRSKGA